MSSTKKKTKPRKLKVNLTSIYQETPGAALVTFRALDEAYRESAYSCEKNRKILARFRDLAAVAAGKPTLYELNEDD